MSRLGFEHPNFRMRSKRFNYGYYNNGYKAWSKSANVTDEFVNDVDHVLLHPRRTQSRTSWLKHDTCSQTCGLNIISDMHLTDVGTTSVPKEHILLHDDECMAQICSPSLVMLKKFSNGTKNSNKQKHLLPQIVLESRSRASEHFNTCSCI